MHLEAPDRFAVSSFIESFSQIIKTSLCNIPALKSENSSNQGGGGGGVVRGKCCDPILQLS